MLEPKVVHRIGSVGLCSPCKTRAYLQNPCEHWLKFVSHARSDAMPGEQAVHIILFPKPIFLVSSAQFIERTLKKDEESQINRMIPGDWGKMEPGWLARSLDLGAKASSLKAGFTGSFGSGRALPKTRSKEPGGEER
jgi:hypothetical protein